MKNQLSKTNKLTNNQPTYIPINQQGQTGVMLLESISPVVLAITGMEEQDEIVPLSFPEAAARARKNKALVEEQRRTHHQPSPLPMSRAIKGGGLGHTMGNTGGAKLSATLLSSQQGLSQQGSTSSDPSRSSTTHMQLTASSSSSSACQSMSHAHPPHPPHHHSSFSSSASHSASQPSIRPSPVVLAVDTTKRNKLAYSDKGRYNFSSFSSSTFSS